MKNALAKNGNFLLFLILAAFLFKGIFLSALFPIFDGQDEARHYNTIQYLADLKGKDHVVNTSSSLKSEKKDSKHLETYAFSQEIKNIILSTDTNVLRTDIFNTIPFSDGYSGNNEEDIRKTKLDPNFYPPMPDMVYGKQLYHKFGAFFEKTFSNQSILFRFYFLRILSVFFGFLVILFSFFIAKETGFSQKHSLLITAIISFQPRLSFYFSGINYDVLAIFLFILFSYIAILSLKNGLKIKYFLSMLILIVLMYLTKITGMILIVPFFAILAYFAFLKIKNKDKKFKLMTLSISLILFAFLFVFLLQNTPAKIDSPTKTIESIGKYLSKSLTIGRMAFTSRAYWGTLGWTNSFILENAIYFIWLIQAISIIGLGIYFFSKKIARHRTAFFVEKKYIVFMIGMIIALQLGIRTADWSIFSQTGSFDLGTPGRYFLPNIIVHIILVFVGLGVFFQWLKEKYKLKFDSEKWFGHSLTLGMILMVTFSMYLIFNVITYRYYL